MVRIRNGIPYLVKWPDMVVAMLFHTFAGNLMNLFYKHEVIDSDNHLFGCRCLVVAK